MMARDRDRLLTLALGIWLTALIWPYTHSGGFVHPFWLSLLPIALAVEEWITPRALGVTAAVATVVVELLLQQPQFQALGEVGLLIHQLWLENPAAWGNMSPLLGLLLIVLATTLGWLVFRQAETRGRVLLLFVLGVLVLAVDHVYWQLPVEAPLATFLLIGLWLLAEAHLSEVAFRSPQGPRPPWYGLAAVLVGVPLIVGWNTPAGPSHVLHPTAVGAGLPGSAGQPGAKSGSRTGLGIGTTGLGIGDTNINHAVKPSQQPVLSITGIPAPAYWQDAVYTTFNGTAWSGNGGVPVIYQVGSAPHPFFTPDVQGFSTTIWKGSFDILEGQGTSRTVVYTGTPLAVDSASSLAPGAVYPGLEQLESPGYSYYNLTMQVPDINWSAVARAPFNAPPAALSADLQLPASLSPEVGILAERATRGATSPWQAALDVKAYLDTHEHYTFDFRANPHVDAVNEFLLVTHAGYCDQFSTTFIMMMRSLGIPARWVVGYAPGTWQPRYHDYLIRAVDAHSWAQVYIAPYGWIPIDPTPGFQIPGVGAASKPATVTPPVQIHPPVPTPVVRHLHIRTASAAGGAASRSFPIWPWIAAVVAAAAGAMGVRRLRRRRAAPGAEAVWTLFRQIAWLASPRQESQPSTLRDRWRLLPADLKPLTLPALGLLEQAWYGNRPPDQAAWSHVIQQLKEARRMAVTLRLRREAG
jgi:transglutaminase-like putative cysteine protease